MTIELCARSRRLARQSRSRVTASRLNVVQGTRALLIDLCLQKLAGLAGGHPHRQHPAPDRRSRRDDGTGSHPAVLTDLRSVENDRSNSNHGAIANATAMDDGAMTHRNLVAKNRWKTTRRNVKRRLILDIRPFTNRDPFDVSAQNGAVEDTRIRSNFNITNDGGPRRNPHTLV